MTSILDVPDHHLTPGMKQYRDIKRENQDCLVMLRMGDFYEMFYEDAVTAAKALEITLTARGQGEKRAPLAGVPFHALETYLGRLIKKGFKVAIVEQLEDPKQAKGLVKRGLARIVTPGTLIESSMLDEKENNYIIAITSFGEAFAMASCDLSTGEFFTVLREKEFMLLSELNRINPSECIIPVSLQVHSDLINLIKDRCIVNPLDDGCFGVERSREILKRIDHQLDERSLPVAGALFQYLLETQKNSLSHIKSISCRPYRMMADVSTLKNLEILKNIREGTAQATLLSVLDKTVTPMGSRLLKRWLKEPLQEREPIEARHQAVAELNRHIIFREEIISLLNSIQDIERLIGRVNYGNATPRDLLALHQSLCQLPLIKEKLQDGEASLLQTVKELDDHRNIAALIRSALKDDPPITIREGGMIRTGYHRELDELQQIKKNSRLFLQELEQREKEKTGISTLRLGFTRVFGYFIEITKKNIPLVPSHYIRKQTTVNSERYITEELKDIEEKILGAEEKINNLEFELFQDIVRRIAQMTDSLQEAAKKIAILDVLSSFAKVSMDHQYVCPVFVDAPIIRIKNGRHPVVERMHDRFISNDVSLEAGETIIITGSNMSGKSTMMRQTALIVFMAQVGCFVPADEATLGIVDQIFTRVGASDDLASGQSTFMMEMQETAAILQQATGRSLIILDEIGRGTSTFDGVSLAWSVVEHIYHKIRAKTMFATHYHVLNSLEEKFEKIRNYTMAVKDVQGEMVMLHKFVPGAADHSHGIHAAKLAGIPADVISRAKEIQKALEQEDEMIKKIKPRYFSEQLGLHQFSGRL